MKSIIATLFIAIALPIFSQSPYQKKIRKLFTKVHYSKEYNAELWELTKSTKIDNPTIYAYKCLYYIMNAKYVVWIGKKMENFNTGRDKLDEAIKKYPGNADLRLVRYAVQKNAPKFLKYYSNIEEDKEALVAYNNSNKTDPELNSLIEGVLKKFP